MRSDGARSVGSRVLVAIAAAFLVGSYQNCGQNGSVESFDHALSDGREITAMAVATTDSEKLSETCRPESLHCLRKVYSPQEEDRQAAEVLCTESSGHCFDVSTFYYNTTFALKECADCGAEAARPGGEYNREEITCWVGKPATSEAASYALRSNFESAVRAALAACGGSLQ